MSSLNNEIIEMSDAVKEIAEKLNVPVTEIKMDKGDHWEDFSGTSIIKE